jgi:competence protein ComEC
MAKRRLDRSIQITGLTAALMVGVLAGRNGVSIQREWLLFSVAVCVIAVVKYSRLTFGLLMCLSAIFGVWRGEVTNLYRTPLGQHIGDTVTVVGTVTDDPGRTTKDQLSFTMQATQLGEQPIGQAVRVLTSYKSLHRGHRVVVTGKLKEGLGAVRIQFSFGQVTVLSTNISPLEKIRAKFFSGMRTAMPEPMSGFGLGLLVGVRALIDKPLQDTLSLVGLSHLVAVSGYNLTIIVQAVRRLLGVLSLFAMTALSLWLIFGFMLVAGFSASIVRAAMVAGLGMFISYYGYEGRPMTLIALPAFITVAVNPDYLLNDLGWQLSFLAFYGIMVLGPLVEQRWVHKPNAVKSLFIEAMAAHIMTLPLIMWRFDQLSVVAPLSNMVVVPLVPLAMLLSFLSSIVGTVAPALAPWIGLPTSGLLAIMIGLTRWFATWPVASVNGHMTGLMAAISYALILIFIFLASRRVEAIKLSDSRMAGTFAGD